MRSKGRVIFHYMKNSLTEIDNELTDDFYQNREKYLAHLDEVIENQRKFFLKDLTIRTLRSTTDFKVKLWLGLLSAI